MTPKRIYISGQITGLPLTKAMTLFNEAEFKIKQEGNIPINPFKVSPYHPNKQWIDYMVDDVKEMLTCANIYKLQNWKNSKGAKIEVLLFSLAKNYQSYLDEKEIQKILYTQEILEAATQVLTKILEQTPQNQTATYLLSKLKTITPCNH